MNTFPIPSIVRFHCVRFAMFYMATMLLAPCALAEDVAKGDTADKSSASAAPAAAKNQAAENSAEPTPADASKEHGAKDEQVAVARPVSPDPVQVYGWREMVAIDGVKQPLKAKLDTGARTSSIHAEEVKLFERDGKKWVRFVIVDRGSKEQVRSRVEAPLVRVARIKEPGGESIAREVVMLKFKIGDRKFRGEFTLNNRSNMLAPVLIGRLMICELGWVDPSRRYLADEKLMR